MSQRPDPTDDDAPTQIFVRSTSPSPARRASLTLDRLWDVKDVARYLKVSRSWVYHRAEAGLLPHRRVGGLLRFEPDKIRDLK